MSDNTEALRLADALELPIHESAYYRHLAAAELRRLHALNAELMEALRVIAGEKPCVDALLGNADIARAALVKVEASK